MIQYSVTIKRDWSDKTTTHILKDICKSENIQFEKCSNAQIVTESTWAPRLVFDYDDGKPIQGKGEEYNLMKT